MRLPRHAFAWATAFALLCAQALGLAHSVAHAHVHESALARALQADCDERGHGHDRHAHDHGPGLFDAHHEEGSPHCLLFDQLAHADGLIGAAAPAQFAAPEASFTDAPTQPRREPCGSGYHARGPPLSLA
jgi:hypothetical protein